MHQHITRVSIYCCCGTHTPLSYWLLLWGSGLWDWGVWGLVRLRETILYICIVECWIVIRLLLGIQFTCTNHCHTLNFWAKKRFVLLHCSCIWMIHFQTESQRPNYYIAAVFFFFPYLCESILAESFGIFLKRLGLLFCLVFSYQEFRTILICCTSHKDIVMTYAYVIC